MKFLLSLLCLALVTLHVAAEIRQKSVKGRIYTGSHCEYIKLCSITSVSGCSDGYKFVIKQNSGVRKQFLIMDGTAILAFVNNGVKFTACTSYTEVTLSVDCKEVAGLSNVDLSATEADDEVVTRVKGYIDAGTCSTVSASTSCGSSASSYYKEVSYGGKRVIIANQVPDHEFEHDIISPNPNIACERYQFISLPIDPAKGTGTRSELGTIGLAVTGAAFFNDWSSPEGAVALVNEGANLDSCFGHSAQGGAYHYHANINCSSAGSASGANDPDTCKLIGYYKDGVPVYGLCKDASGQQMTSCYSCTGTCTSSVTTAGGTYSGLGADDGDYSYDSAAFTAGTCNLDEGNGALHPTTGKYSYFMTTSYPWVPVYHYGDQGTTPYCSAA